MAFSLCNWASIKPTTGQQITLKMSYTLEPTIQSGDTAQRMLFLTAINLLSITWISIRMATTCLGHLVNNTWSLQENSQSECTYSAVEISYGIPRTLLKISQSQHCNLFWAVHTHGTYDPLRFPTLQINEDSVILGTTVINQSVVAMPSSEWVHQLLQ